MSTPIENTVNITEVSRNFAKIVKSLPERKYVVVMKNYKPVAKISAPDDVGFSFSRRDAWGKNTQEIADALDHLESLSDDDLPLLLKKKK